MSGRPQNVGILAMQIHFPANYIIQSELEEYDGVSAGKYTIGLGQDSMSFCNDQEDVVSMSMTVLQQLLEKTGVDPSAIGRLDVGSETIIDKSKSIKSALMPLFEASGNSDVEGADSTNACYGGTAALLNALNWIESSAWDGRYAVVVAADSAVYAPGPARPTGGAGAVAMLLGPDAPLVMERHLIGSHASHVYDFYKPKLASEYAVVDGKLSQTCYLTALDKCYSALSSKFEKKEGRPIYLADVDYVVCHSPYNKLVQKSFARLVYDDFMRSSSSVGPEAAALLEPFAKLTTEQSYEDRGLEKAAMTASKALYAAKVAPSTKLPKQVGNMYCASLYSSLASLLAEKGTELGGKTLLMFSYGSGLIASMFVVKARAGEASFTLEKLISDLGVPNLLASRLKVSPASFAETMVLMEERYGACGYKPSASPDDVRPGTFFLTAVDDLYRRFYERKPLALAGSSPVAANGTAA